MANETDILELKFEGNGVNPEVVKPSEIATLIEHFEKALLETIKVEYPAVDTEQVLFSFDSLKNESIGINFSSNSFRIPPEIKTLVLNSYLLITTSISENRYENLSPKTIASLKKISSFSRAYSCNANFRHNGKSLSTITPSTEIRASKLSNIKGDTTIYGKLLDVGGENPNIHIKLNEGYVLIIDTEKDVAKKLGSRLFDTIGLKGNAKWDAVTSEILDFKLYEVLDYNSGNVSTAINELKDLFSNHWDNFNTNDEINNQLLRD